MTIKLSSLKALAQNADTLDHRGLYTAADFCMRMLVCAGVPTMDREMSMPAEMTLEDAVNNFDAAMYKVDVQGAWNESDWAGIEEFIESLPEGAMDCPASVDGNHIVVFLPEEGVQVFNLVPREQWGKGK